MSIPREVLTVQGTQFMSECIQEVSRLLSIKGLTSRPYHPICNGLDRDALNPEVHAEEALPRPAQQWHRLINPVLFAYREFP